MLVLIVAKRRTASLRASVAREPALVLAVRTEKGRPMILVTNDRDERRELADRAMRPGEAAVAFTRDDLLVGWA